MTPAKIFFYLCLSFISGVAASSKLDVSRPLLLGFLILGIVLISIFWKHKKTAVAGFCVILFALGVWRVQGAIAKLQNNGLEPYNNDKEIVTLIGKVILEPDEAANSTKLLVLAEKLIKNTGSLIFSERVLVTTASYPEYNYGDQLEIKGKLETPPDFEGFNYREYLRNQGIGSVMSWPEIKIIEKRNYDNFLQRAYGGILSFKTRLKGVSSQYLPLEQSSLLTAMILGEQSQMPARLKENLNATGLRHITAVSGMNVAILSGILMSLLVGLGFWRGQAFYLAILLIFLFIIIIGFQASAVRAGIMGITFLLGQKLGRKSVAIRAIFVAASLMLLINPLLLAEDIGFQLSFLATLGMIFFQPILQNWLGFVPDLINIRSIISTTFAAQIFTLPVIIYNFGQVSFISPLTNILILPVVYWIMIFGIVLMVLGSFWLPLAWFFIWPSWLILTYCLTIIDIFAKPWAAKTFGGVHWVWPIIFYLGLALFIWRARNREKLKFLGR